MNTQSPQTSAPAPATATQVSAAGPVPQPGRVPAAAGAVGSPVQRCSICGKNQTVGVGAPFAGGGNPGFNAAGGFGSPGGYSAAGCPICAGQCAPAFAGGGGGFQAGFNLGVPSAQAPGFGFNVQAPVFAAPQATFQGPSAMMMMPQPMPMPMPMPTMGGGFSGGMQMPGMQMQMPAAQMQMPMGQPMMGGGIGMSFNPYDPQANPAADAYAYLRQQSWTRYMKWAMGGSVVMGLLVMGIYFFFEWYNHRNDAPAVNDPAVQAPADPGVVQPPANTTPGQNFTWVNPSLVPPGFNGTQNGLPQPAQNPQNLLSQQFPGLPISYLNGGFGWFVANEQAIVYVAHDADMNTQVSARAFLAQQQLTDPRWRIVVVGANASLTEPSRPIAGGPPYRQPNGSTALTAAQRQELLSLLLDAKRHAESLRGQIRGETQLRYHLTPQHHQTLDPDIDGSISSIDEAIGMLRGGDSD